jgi:hypothetical protein
MELIIPLSALTFLIVTMARESSLSKACFADMASGAPVEE